MRKSESVYVPRHGSFLIKNSSRATQPPPTRTITVLRKIRTRRNFCESPNCAWQIGKKKKKTHVENLLISIWLEMNFSCIFTRYFPSPTWKTRNFCRHVHNMTKRLTSSWILSASLGGLRSCQSGRRAAMNSCQSISPSPLRSNRSATAPISKRDVSNSILGRNWNWLICFFFLSSINYCPKWNDLKLKILFYSRRKWNKNPDK